ncbi:MAG: ABC transporter ATP-binding protein [Candidatus Dadabacteria bacterium]|nr:MAG: ABC transporter ATP-binding protein [Candidatus Dadabacteria bacterium]
MITIKHLTKSYREAGGELVVIKDLSVEFPPCGTVAIIGESGVGKSTLLYLLAGLDRATAGEVFFNQVPISKWSEEKLSKWRLQNLGFVFQFHNLLPEFTAQENVAMPLILAGKSYSQALSEAKKLLIRLGLKKRLTHKPAKLSGGENQRTALARAFVAKPKLVLADEPTGNLDPDNAEKVINLLLESALENQSLVITATHNSQLADKMDSVFLMESGGKLKKIK